MDVCRLRARFRASGEGKVKGKRPIRPRKREPGMQLFLFFIRIMLFLCCFTPETARGKNNSYRAFFLLFYKNGKRRAIFWGILADPPPKSHLHPENREGHEICAR